MGVMDRMGRQRAHRKSRARVAEVELALRGAPETGFRAVVRANMGAPIIARSARFLCRCGAEAVSYAGFPPGAARRCGGCGAVYRVEHDFDREAFERRPDRGPWGLWPIGVAVALGGQPIHYEPEQ